MSIDCLFHCFVVHFFSCVSSFSTDKMPDNSMEMTNPNEPRKKKYAKEAWPGRKPLLSGL